jgi:uncharacterized protein (TIGR03067 family)
MRATLSVLFVWTPLLLTPLAAGNSPPKSDLEEFQGYWDLKGYEHEQENIDPGIDPGRPAYNPLLSLFGAQSDGHDAGIVLHVQKNICLFSRGGDLVLRTAELSLDAGKNPKAIDVTFGMPGKQKALLGIYELEGDKLTLCFADGDNRPLQFKGKRGQIVLHYERSDNDKTIREFLDRIKKK